jgi:hypothetical protein
MAQLRRAILIAILVVGVACGKDERGEDNVPAADGAVSDSARCIRMYPSGAGPVAPQEVVAQAVSECREDTSECRSPVACGGTVEGRICDESRLISWEAVRCVAAGAGLAEGLNGIGGGLVYNFRFRRITWSVGNTLYDRSRVGGDFGGQLFTIDGVTAELLEKSTWLRIRN